MAREFPAIKLFSTLSPIPLFRQTLANPEIFNATRLSAILRDDVKPLCEKAGEADIVKAVGQLITNPAANRDVLSGPLQRLALAYLACVKRGDRPHDPVANFHLSNGARLERINVYANPLPRGVEESAGVMVNYRYIPDAFESNHEAFIHHNRITLSRKLQRGLKGIRELW